MYLEREKIYTGLWNKFLEYLYFASFTHALSFEQHGYMLKIWPSDFHIKK